MILLCFIIVTIESTLLYYYLHRKTHISLSYLYKDNLVVIVVVVALDLLLEKMFTFYWLIALSVAAVPVVCILLTLVRFYRVPMRKVTSSEDSIVSPADGNIIYIKKLPSGEVPMTVKNGISATLNEFADTKLLDSPCWLIGINMTPFDVHKNAAPVEGIIVLNHHVNGEFLSLKHPEALARNERNSIIIENPRGNIGLVQTASKRVRRIVSYKKQGDVVGRGDWFGMIRFGSQVDLVIPETCHVVVNEKQQVYAKKTVIATW